MIDSKKLKFVDGSTFKETYSYWEKELKKARREGNYKKVREIYLTIEDIERAEFEALEKAQRNFFNNKVVDFLTSLITLSFLNFSARKLIGGTIRIVSVCLFYSNLGEEGRIHAQRDLVAYFTNDPNSVNYQLLASLIIMIIGVYSVYLFVRGFYLVYTFQHEEVPMFKKMTSEQRAHQTDIKRGEYKNIAEAYAYRDSMMNGMSRENASRYFIETNSLLNSSTSDSVKSYIDSKLGGMSNANKIEYLKGNR